MTCPTAPDADQCTDDTPCAPCPHPRTVVDGTEWACDRTQGWHAPAGEEAAR